MPTASYAPLFESYRLPAGIELKNRLVMAPMTNFASNPDGSVSDNEIQYYIRRSGGAGMVITACAYVTASGKGFPGEFGSDRDELIPSLRRLADAIKGEGAKAVLQIFHGGRQCPPDLLPDGQPVSASAVTPDQPNAATPRALEEAEIEAIIRDFGESARRAIEAGFDGVEIHGANGYLIQQFFSGHTNRREDRWGGSVDKRLAFPLAVVDEVQRVVKEHARAPFVVGYRFSPEEPEENGLTMTDTFALIDALADKGLDYLHVSLMEFWSEARRGAEARPRIELIRDRVGGRVPLIGVGSLYKAEEALKAFNESGIPLIALGRPLIIDPDWVQKVEQGREQEIETELDLTAQERLVIPEPLWQAIVNSPGWFPVKK
ncbi:NADH-dependent flavin oxidoreductase [Paenibacillus turpanensis]|uniref:NADH-dependent flavin oxidoreductase n=1 Tax=Paenibacillus turpanensis TaxID=2689078 RepID=UPI00140A1A58|nr:NADH-dependent flavin oxidoreductase [Paenibacillus turpanensis]